jgi:hypothetical protein
MEMKVDFLSFTPIALPLQPISKQGENGNRNALFRR